MKIFWQLRFWKEKLLRDLNNNVLNVIEWEKFIEAAHEGDCQMMALDMQNRLDNYRIQRGMPGLSNKTNSEKGA